MDETLRKRLESARLYLCTDARADRGDLAEFLDAALAGGVDIVQLRDKTLDARDELAALEVVREACDRHGALLAVNDRADIAHAVNADVLHLGQRDLPVRYARAILGDRPLSAAADREEGVDYFCIGPVWATPTKPGRPAAGLDEVARVAALHPQRPWFAIGGINEDNLDQVLAAGARRAVVVRAITEAEDPRAAAAELKRRLVAAAAA